MTLSDEESEFLFRTGEELGKELKNPLVWWYLSFSEPKKFLGVVVLEAHGIVHASMKANAMKINPGGQMIGAVIPPEVPLPLAADRNRILSRADVLRIWPDARRLGDLK